MNRINIAIDGPAGAGLAGALEGCGMLAIEWEVVLFFALGVLLLYGLGWLLLVPFRRVLWFLLNSLAGILAPENFVGRAPQQTEEYILEEVDPALAPYAGLLGETGKVSV